MVSMRKFKIGDRIVGRIDADPHTFEASGPILRVNTDYYTIRIESGGGNGLTVGDTWNITKTSARRVWTIQRIKETITSE